MSRLYPIPLTALCLLLAGCQGARGPRLAKAGAPGLDGEPRNAANPNAPFAMSSAGLQGPRLRQRELLLDVNGVPRCDGMQLALDESGAASSETHHVVRLSFRNTGEACRLSGFPTVTLIREDGSIAGSVRLERISDERMAATLKPVGAQDSGLPGPSPQVLLPALRSAAFQLGWTAGPDCERISRVAVGAPDTTRPSVLARPLTVCENRVLITAVAPNH